MLTCLAAIAATVSTREEEGMLHRACLCSLLVWRGGRPKYDRMFLPPTVDGVVFMLPLSERVTTSC